ncbi:MAG: HAMP domain-containing sensor histidine kinase [Longicatena sp.]
MKKQYMKALKRKLFFKYTRIVAGITLGGIGLIYLFDDILNGVVIDFIRLFIRQGDPVTTFETFQKVYAILFPTVIVGAGFILIYYLCKDLVNYMQILMDGIDDVMQKERVQINFPKDMLPTEQLVLNIANDYQRHLKSLQADEVRKKDLIYLLAQDIKLPLSRILMYLEFLEQEKRISPDIQKDYIVKVLYKSMDLEDMINEFFNITRFNLQYAKWNPENMLLDRMMEQVIDEYIPFIEEKEMDVKLESGVHLELYADNDKIARVMRDLLRNIVELGKKQETIIIHIDQSEEQYELVFKVLSYHLSAYQLAHLFHNYYRLEDVAESGKVHVLGLGIAKQIMDMHQGDLIATSIGDMLAFHVRIPYKKNVKIEEKEL